MSKQSRTNNGPSTSDVTGSAIVLAIDKMHADRIFAGDKKFELRKKLPNEPFDTVYLYVNGKQGIAGAFRVGKVLRDTIDNLWQRVGPDATPKERFYKYFNSSESGSAIQVLDPVQFSPAIDVGELRKKVAKFTAPQSYLLLRPGDRLLDVLRTRGVRVANNRSVTLRPIDEEEEEQFIRIVTREIGAKYEGITTGFAKSLLNTHRLGRDPRGILTRSKEVMSICDDAGTLLGFTTITYKLGGCVKTGPTILLPKYRGKGLGGKVRQLLESHVSAQKARKLYCTCPDDDEPVLRYLLNAGYFVEAHLRAHYHQAHGELVLGRFIGESTSPPAFSIQGDNTRLGVAQLTLPVSKPDQAALLRIFKSYFPAMTKGHLSGILSRANLDPASPVEEKPLQILAIRSQGVPKGLVLLIPKRGGAVKGLVLTNASNQQTLRRIVNLSEDFVSELGARKLYFVLESHNVAFGVFLRKNDFQLEGALREPYRVGIDCLVLSRFLDTV